MWCNAEKPWAVALRKESVDRNNPPVEPVKVSKVALRKESVDRNRYFYIIKITGNTSLSARRAWIEIEMQHNVCRDFGVALRKESVDRNTSKMYFSALYCKVALRKESVDRNGQCLAHCITNSKSLSARRAWIEI